MIWGKIGKVFVPTPEDFPQANRSFPQTREINLKLSSNLLFLRTFIYERAFVPALVRSDVLQLTFRVVKVNLPMLPIEQRPCQGRLPIIRRSNMQNGGFLSFFDTDLIQNVRKQTLHTIEFHTLGMATCSMI